MPMYQKGGLPRRGLCGLRRDQYLPALLFSVVAVKGVLVCAGYGDVVVVVVIACDSVPCDGESEGPEMATILHQP
jgi:hypothetical protein